MTGLEAFQQRLESAVLRSKAKEAERIARRAMLVATRAATKADQQAKIKATRRSGRDAAHAAIKAQRTAQRIPRMLPIVSVPVAITVQPRIKSVDVPVVVRTNKRDVHRTTRRELKRASHELKIAACRRDLENVKVLERLFLGCDQTYYGPVPESAPSVVEHVIHLPQKMLEDFSNYEPVGFFESVWDGGSYVRLNSSGKKRTIPNNRYGNWRRVYDYSCHG